MIRGLNAPLVGLSLLAAGHRDVAVYDGPLEEWMQDPDAPIALRDSARTSSDDGEPAAPH